MHMYLITYDLEDRSKSQSLLDSIKSHEDWSQVAESSYFVVSEDSLRDIIDTLQKITEGKIQVYGFPVRSFYGFGPKGINECLAKYLKVEVKD